MGKIQVKNVSINFDSLHYYLGGAEVLTQQQICLPQYADFNKTVTKATDLTFTEAVDL